MTIKDLYKKYHFSSVADFSRCLGVPYNTVTSWLLLPENPNYRHCPDWLPEILDVYLSVKRAPLDI